MTLIAVHHPPRTMDELADALVTLTEHIVNKDPDREVSGFLGGRFGYGADWTSPVFDMRPFYWGDCDCGYIAKEEEWCDTHSHGGACYQADLKRELIAAGGKDEGWYIDRPKRIGYERWRAIEDAIYDRLCAKHRRPRKAGAASHCTCAYQREWSKWSKANTHLPTCSTKLPNFRHHASGLEVRWYKYIGRGMETTGCEAPDVAAILAACIADVAAPPFEPWKPEPITAEMMDRWLKECDALLDASEELAEAESGPYHPDDDIPF